MQIVSANDFREFAAAVDSLLVEDSAGHIRVDGIRVH
jgi:hypothetical protein